MKKWILLAALIALPTTAHAGVVGRCRAKDAAAEARFTALCTSINISDANRCCTEFMRRGMAATNQVIQSRQARQVKRTDDQAFEQDFPLPVPTPAPPPIPTATPTATPSATATATPTATP